MAKKWLISDVLTCPMLLHCNVHQLNSMLKKLKKKKNLLWNFRAYIFRKYGQIEKYRNSPLSLQCFLSCLQRNSGMQHRPERQKEFYHKLLLYLLHWLTWFPSCLSSAGLLIHLFRSMNYTAKEIGALACCGACEKERIPVPWQVAIKVL